MEKSALITGIAKLAKAAQDAGFSVEQMIGLLNAGLSVEGLVDLIAWRLQQPTPMAPVAASSVWIV